MFALSFIDNIARAYLNPKHNLSNYLLNKSIQAFYRPGHNTLEGTRVVCDSITKRSFREPGPRTKYF